MPFEWHVRERTGKHSGTRLRQSGAHNLSFAAQANEGLALVRSDTLSCQSVPHQSINRSDHHRMGEACDRRELADRLIRVLRERVDRGAGRTAETGRLVDGARLGIGQCQRKSAEEVDETRISHTIIICVLNTYAICSTEGAALTMTDLPLRSTDISRRVAVGAMIASAACWGGATVMSRDILASLSAPGLLVVQLVASLAFLSVLTVRERPMQHATPALVRAALPGVLEPGLAYTVGLIGLAMTTAGHAAVISSAEPVFIVALSWLLLREQPTRRLLACIFVAIGGLLLIAGGGEAGESSAGVSLTGDALVVLATIFAAGYVVFSARVARGFPSATLAFAQQTVGLLFAVIVYGTAAGLGIVPPLWTELDAALLGYAALSGIVQYALPFWLYLIGLRRLRASTAGLYLTLTPVFGIAGAFLWLGEQPHAAMLLGTILVLAAVVAGSRER